jgi:hypothetical protein
MTTAMLLYIGYFKSLRHPFLALLNQLIINQFMLGYGLKNIAWVLCVTDITTKSMKREGQFALIFLRDLRPLRGEFADDQI